MTNLDINRKQGNGNEKLKQIEGDGWTSIYLPAICAGIIMTVVLFVAIACSKKSDSSANRISAPAESAASSRLRQPLRQRQRRRRRRRSRNIAR